ncbi:MAG TPA: SDR family NAD(P)-dependent oxidoreductase [Candidatus Sumerlaeota bacterium]|nr:SDR family NAD(P)-dependent oxidoreductase [Candidatus Sumerlaeota bacterium]HOR27158.1 SDR family NAD(P)-dependent oxidoreductase [Candidatus Sumerlaeota bacterium]HPK01498.1 SDR family NAD(P)-dependent oxidoreductase [Candidatus Sumerlaeota bacterium]
MQLENRVAYITGGGSGIGKAAAVLLAAEGARVCVTSRDLGDLEETVQEIEEGGGEAFAVAGDIARVEDVERAVRQVVERWGRLDIVFANAGINGVWAPIEEIEPEEWDTTLNINLRGTFLTLRAAMPHLKRQGGSIIITSSINGTRVFSSQGATAYGCSKAAQVALCKFVALESARHGVRVNVICPGAIATDIDSSTEMRDADEAAPPLAFPENPIPLSGGKPGDPHQVARLVLFLASDASSHITGTEIWIDGAQSLLRG